MTGTLLHFCCFFFLAKNPMVMVYKSSGFGYLGVYEELY